MKIIAINGSPKKAGNTFHALKQVTDVLEKSGIETEILHIGNKEISGCMACGGCIKNMNERCNIKDDIVNESIQKLKEADGFILGSPTYFAAINGTMKSFLDRIFYVAGVNKSMFRHKVGAALVTVRRTGGKTALNELYNYLTYGEILIPTSNYWTVVHGASPQEVLQDEEGIQTLRVLGTNMSWLLKLVENGKDKVLEPEREDKVYMNFIR